MTRVAQCTKDYKAQRAGISGLLRGGRKSQNSRNVLTNAQWDSYCYRDQTGMCGLTKQSNMMIRLRFPETRCDTSAGMFLSSVELHLILVGGSSHTRCARSPLSASERPEKLE